MTHIDQNLLADLPFGLLLIDPDNRIGWANQSLCELLDMACADLTGKALAELPEPARGLLSTPSRLYHLATQKRWVSREMRTGADGQRLLILSDVTAQEGLAEENARLRQQVEDLKLTDELTGLPNKRAISQALDLHISRSRRYKNPLSVVLVHANLHALSRVQPLSNDPVLLGVSRFLRDRLRWVDQIARWEDNVFLLVLPETVEADARGLLAKIVAEEETMVLPESYGELRPQLTFGLACWQKGDDMRTLLRHALDDLRDNSGV